MKEEGPTGMRVEEGSDSGEEDEHTGEVVVDNQMMDRMVVVPI